MAWRATDQAEASDGKDRFSGSANVQAVTRVNVEQAPKTSVAGADAAGNLTGTADARGNLTQYLVDADNRATVTVDALAGRATSYFDAAGNLTGSRDANTNLTQYLIDADNRASVTIDKQRGQVRFYVSCANCDSWMDWRPLRT